MEKPKLEEYDRGQIEYYFDSTKMFFRKDQLQERIKWLKSQITLNDVNNRNVINAIDKAFSELFKEE